MLAFLRERKENIRNKNENSGDRNGNGLETTRYFKNVKEEKNSERDKNEKEETT